MNETTCDTNNYCSNAYLWCNGNGVCGCHYMQGAALHWSINGTVNGPFTNHLPLT